MNREEIKKAVADTVVSFARSEAEGSADEEPHRPTGSGNPDHHQLVGEDSEQAVYYFAAASGQSYCG